MSKIVVGDVNVVTGQYNVDARVINVESGTIAATEGATFSGSSYRTTMQSIAQKLAAKIAITSGGTVYSQQSTSPQRRSKVEVVYGYLKIFPNEIGEFDAEPSSVIRQINNQAQYGYNNWRIPTNEELALIRANGYIGQNKYMTKESRQGLVLLVTDGKDAATLQQEAEEEERRKTALRAQGWIDLGLPSGTLWKDQNEAGGFYSYDQAMAKFGRSLPTKEQLGELKNSCRWTWNGNGYKVEGPSGESIVLPAAGYRDCDGGVYGVGSDGYYWSSTPYDSGNAWRLFFYSRGAYMQDGRRCIGQSVRLVR